MTLQARIKSHKGITLINMVLGVIVVGVLIFPLVKWYLSFWAETSSLEEKLEMQTILKDYRGKFGAASYDDFQQMIAEKGTSWTEDIGGRYNLRVEFSEDSKFEDALCNIGAVAGDGVILRLWSGG